MKKLFWETWRKIKENFLGKGKTAWGLWGEVQLKKLDNLGQEIVVMRRGR